MERLRLGELLVGAGYITPGQLEMALASAGAEGGKLGSTLLKLGMIDADTLARALGKQRAAVPVRHIELEKIDASVIPLVPPHLAHKHRAVPVHMTAPGTGHNALLVAFVDPTSLTAVDEIAFAANMRIEIGIAPEALIDETLDRIYPQPQARHTTMIDLDPTAVGTIATPEWAASWLRETKSVLEQHEDGCVLLVSHDDWKALLVRRRAVLELVEEYIARTYDMTRQLTLRSKQDRSLISHFWRRGFMHQKDATHHTPPGLTPGRIDEAFLPAIRAWTDGRLSSRIERVAIPRSSSNPAGAQPAEASMRERSAPPRSASVPPTLQVITGAILREPPRHAVTVEPVLLLTKRKQVNGQIAAPPPAAPAEAPIDEESTLEEIQIIGDVEPIPEPAAEPPPSEPPPPDAAPPLQVEVSRVESAPTVRAEPVPITIASVVDKIRRAPSTDDIGGLIIDYLETFTQAALVLVVKDGVALGWKGHAPKADKDVIESLIWPLTSPIVAEAYESATMFRGPPPEDGGHIGQRLWKMLHVSPPAEIAVAPIELKGRIVNLVYAHPFEGGSLPETIGETLAALAKAAGDRYLELIEKKRRET